MEIDDVIGALGYSGASENWITSSQSDPATAHILRMAERAGVRGSYVYRTSPKEMPVLPARVAVHIAEASGPDEARALHRRLWNLGDAPFLIVVLPDHVRVYSGFDYDPKEDGIGLLQAAGLSVGDLRERLADFYADEIDSGRIWQTQGKHLSFYNRVDYKLLRNLENLGQVLIQENDVPRAIAHALIGKYIYISYLMDRKILSEEWLLELGIERSAVLGRDATLKALRSLVRAVEERFNGGMFPLPLEGSQAPSDAVVSYVASVFAGDDAHSGQLALDFGAYDFSFIPVELLSSIYEQFLHAEGQGKDVGAVYTSEPLADYLLCELNYCMPLRQDTKILDPCCGSGVFLVLAYQRLIELQAAGEGRRLTPDELKQILVKQHLRRRTQLGRLPRYRI